jgi:hypothetical protein
MGCRLLVAPRPRRWVGCWAAAWGLATRLLVQGFGLHPAGWAWGWRPRLHAGDGWLTDRSKVRPNC